jgi:hypothetical protein
MSNDDQHDVPAQGQAWLGDWRARAHARLSGLGFRTFADLAASKPRTSIVQLANRLSIDPLTGANLSDVAAVQVSSLWVAEAELAGPEAVEWMARFALVGELQERIPEGFPDWNAEVVRYRAKRSLQSPVWRLIQCFGALGDLMGEAYDRRSHRVYESLIQRAERGDVPAGWLPADPGDPILAEAFRNNWHDHDETQGS